MFKMQALIIIFDWVLLFLSRQCVLQPIFTARFCPNNDQIYMALQGQGKKRIVRNIKYSHTVSISTTQFCH